MTSDDDYCQRPYEAAEASKTLVLSCEVLTPTVNDDDDDGDSDPASHPLHCRTDLPHPQHHATLMTVPGSSSPQRVFVECQCPYSVYDRFPCSPHGGCLTTPSPGTPTPISAASSTTTTTCAGSESGGGAGSGGADAVSRRIQGQRGPGVYNCGPQPELLECLS